MIVIVEGPDGAGKTTLIDQLEQGSRDAIYHHFGAPANDEEAFNYYKKYAEAINNCRPEALNIFDRSWYSDMVYGPVMRGRHEMTQEHADMLAAMVVANSGGMVIYCTAPVKNLWARCRARGEEYVTEYEQLKAIAERYADVMKHCVRYLPVVRYDTAARW